MRWEFDLARALSTWRTRGRVVGRYEVDAERLRPGRYRARDLTLEEKVGFTVLPEHLWNEDRFPAVQERLERVRRLDHPRILPATDVGRTAECAYRVTPWFDGEPLVDRLAGLPPLDEDRVYTLCREIAAALFHAHSRGVTHGSLDPDCILVLREDDEPLETGPGIPDPPPLARPAPNKGFFGWSSDVRPHNKGLVPDEMLPHLVEPRRRRPAKTEPVPAPVAPRRFDVRLTGFVEGPFRHGTTQTCDDIVGFGRLAEQLMAHACQPMPGLALVVARCVHPEAELRYPDLAGVRRDLERLVFGEHPAESTLPARPLLPRAQAFFSGLGRRLQAAVATPRRRLVAGCVIGVGVAALAALAWSPWQTPASTTSMRAVRPGVPTTLIPPTDKATQLALAERWEAARDALRLAGRAAALDTRHRADRTASTADPLVEGFLVASTVPEPTLPHIGPRPRLALDQAIQRVTTGQAAATGCLISVQRLHGRFQTAAATPEKATTSRMRRFRVTVRPAALWAASVGGARASQRIGSGTTPRVTLPGPIRNLQIASAARTVLGRLPVDPGFGRLLHNSAVSWAIHLPHQTAATAYMLAARRLVLDRQGIEWTADGQGIWISGRSAHQAASLLHRLTNREGKLFQGWALVPQVELPAPRGAAF